MKKRKNIKIKGSRDQLMADARKLELITAKLYSQLSPNSIIKHNDSIIGFEPMFVAMKF